MNLLKKIIRSMSGKDLEGELAWTSQGKEKEHYPEGYLNQVRVEIKRREIKKEKRNAKS